MFVTGAAMWWYRVVRKRDLVEDDRRVTTERTGADGAIALTSKVQLH
jgi:hypothetical protein